MKRQICLVMLIFVGLSQFGCSRTRGAAQPPELQNLSKLQRVTTVKLTELRFAALKQAALEVGAQAGLAWRSKGLNELLQSQARSLNRIFDFNALLLNQNLLPPILVEGQNSLNMADDFTLRVSDRDYQIIQQPRFITAPPLWQDYLWLPYHPPETPNRSMLPKTADERKVWNEFLKLGWTEGVEQADQIFTANLARLKRDFQGMVLYRKLLAQKMLTPPFTSEAELGVTGDGEKLRINDRVLRISVIPQLENNLKKWRPVVTQKPS